MRYVWCLFTSSLSVNVFGDSSQPDSWLGRFTVCESVIGRVIHLREGDYWFNSLWVNSGSGW